MKRLLSILTLILAFAVVASAQTKAETDAVSTIEKAKADAENPKKNTKVATWLKLAKAYVDAYNLPSKSIMVGVDETATKLALGREQVLSTSEAIIEGQPFKVDTYRDKDLYYSPEGTLSIIKVTKRPVEDALELAYDAYLKAAEVDPKGTKVEEIKTALININTLYNDEAMTYYALEDIENANKYFEKSLKGLDNPVVNDKDSIRIYYTALTSSILGDNTKALKYYEEAKSIGYYVEGDVYASIAILEKELGNIDAAKTNLLEGFSKFPSNQSILIALINLYTETGDDPNKILELIRAAQENEPNNASLYYTEGNVYKNLGDIDKAIELYAKSSQVDPTYVYGYYTIGALYYDNALDIQTAANDEMDDNKYMKMMDEMSLYLRKAIEPFENAFAITQDPEIKEAIALYLKQIYFRFREESPEFMQNYEKYNALVEE